MTVVSIVAHSRPFVVGVDTHARNHVYAILAPATGALLDTRSFPSSAAGITRAITWVARRTEADADVLWVIEGAASYGAILAGVVAGHGYLVAETPRMDSKARRGVGKSDALDAHQIAATTLRLPEEKLRRPRLSDGIRQGVRILVTARESMTKDRTRSVNANALVRASEAAPLLEETGVKAISAAKILTAWSHEGRVRNEAAFASLAGVNPVPASSGNTVRHRLNRGGDRSLNSALHMVVISKMTPDAETRKYVEKRRAEHRTNREIRRCLKRYLARRVYRILNASTIATSAA